MVTRSFIVVAIALVLLLYERPLTSRAALQVTPWTPTVDSARLRQCVLDNGLGYGAFRDGQSPDAAIYPTEKQIEEDMVFVSRLTRRLRTYRSGGSFAAIPALAEKLAMRAAMGIALGSNSAANEEEIAAGIRLAHSGLVQELIVGNEVLTGGLLSKEELVAYLRRVRRDVPPEILVTTAETWDKWLLNPDLIEEVTYVMAHFYPFWEGQPVEGAAANVIDRYRALQRTLDSVSRRGPVRIVIGETGWPSAGPPRVSHVVPDPLNQRRFAEELITAACDNSIPFYFFSVFDEEFKWQEGATSRLEPQDFPRDRTFSGKWIGSSWGLAHSNGKIKPLFADMFAQPDIGSRRHRDIFVDGQLAAYYDIGVDTSQLKRDWLTTSEDSLKMSYPAGQEWGAVFITVGPPVAMPRPWKDFSDFGVLSLELRGERGGEVVEVGIKRYNDPDDGSERKVTLALDTSFERYDIDLRQFGHSRFVVPDDLARLYVVTEFVFSGHTPQTVYARNIRYLSTN
jgi:exo-beta-1,3-glucanase (GH17 family)